MRGVVKWFSRVKGYGFIIPDLGQGVLPRDVFFHPCEFDAESRAELVTGEIVEFEVGEDRRGRRCAVHVRRIGAAKATQRRDTPGVVSPARMAEAPGAPRTG